MGKFDWVKEHKRQAKQDKKSQVDYTVSPVSSRFGMWQNTGYGPDGVNQPNMPAMQLQSGRGPVNLHEGEPYRQLPDGSIQVVSQRDLLRDEQRGVQGMQAGGIISPRRQPAARQSFQAQNITPKPITPDVTPVNITQPDKPQDINITQPITPQTQGFDITGAPKTKDPFFKSPGDIQDIDITQPVQTGLAGRQPALQAVNPTPTPMPEPKPVEDVTPETIPDEQKDFYENMFKKGMGWVEQMMQGGSPAQQALYKKWMDDTAARQATERMVGAQQAAQGRLGETTAAARALMVQRMHGIELGDIAAKGGIEQMQAAERAAEKLAQLGLQGMNFQQAQEQFEFAKDQFDYGKQLDTINALLQEGGEDNFKQASLMFQEMYGKDIDFSNSLTQENIGKFNQGWNNLGGLIASGMSWEDALKVMQQDGTLDLLGLDEGEVESIYKQQQLMSDPLYQQMQMIENWVEQGIITQDEADDLLDLMNYAMTHPEGFDIQDGWVIEDSAGNEVGFFTSEEEANKFLEDNPDKDYSSKYMEGHIGTTGVGIGDGGDDDTGLGTGTPKEQFNNFMDKHVPEKFEETFTQQMWEDAGRPETWEDYLKKNPFGEIGSLIDSGGDVVINDDKLGDIYKAILDNDVFVKGRYGVEDDILTEYVRKPEDITLNDVDINKHIKDNTGRIIRGPEGDGLLILGGEILEKGLPDSDMKERIAYLKVYDFKSGEYKTIPFAQAEKLQEA